MVKEGIIAGPRMAASGRDICATSGMLDWNPSFWKLGMDGLSIFADGVDEVRKATRININEGADVIKVYVSGEGLLRPNTPPEETMYSYEEIAVVVEEAHKRNRQVAAHVRGNDGVKLCVKAGVDVLEHATYADDEAVAMIAERKDDIFVVPGLGYHWGILVNGPACGITEEHLAATEYQDEWEKGCIAMDKLRKAGVRVVPGGDYGFVWCPHGQYAKDIELFVTDMGFSPMEAIVAATKHGSELLRLDHECGTIEEGKCADILVVDGDPLADIAILQDRSKLSMVMANGKVMVNTLGLQQELTHIPDLPDGHRAHPERQGRRPDDAHRGGGAALNHELNGHRAHVEEFGSGPPVVLVHGLGGTGASIWKHQIADLASDSRVITYDLRGSGQSEVTPGPYTIDLLAEDLRALVERARARARRARRALDGRLDRARLRGALSVRRLRARRHRRAGDVPRPGPHGPRGRARETVESEGMGAVAETVATNGVSPTFREGDPPEFEEFIAMLEGNDPRGYAAQCRALVGLEHRRPARLDHARPRC